MKNKIHDLSSQFHQDFHWGHEPCYYAVGEGKSSHWCGDRKQSTVWKVPNLNPIGGSREEPVTGHGTQKPIELMRRSILNNTVRGDTLTTPTAPSGLIRQQLWTVDSACHY